MFKRRNKNRVYNVNTNLRFNVLTVFMYIVGIILIVQLFNLQIVHGAEYREQSNTRLTRETTLEAQRGTIMDKSGNVLVSSEMKFELELYKTKIDDATLNQSILNIIAVLEKYGVSYPDSFPITINPYGFKLEGEDLVDWLDYYGIKENATAEEAFNEFKDKYEITNTDVVESRKIMCIRYEITTKGYSSTRALTIAKDIPREAVAEFSENNSKYPGVNIVVTPETKYTMGSLAANVLGYTSTISAEEYNTAIENIDSCIFLLQHIEEKDKFTLKNIF